MLQRRVAYNQFLAVQIQIEWGKRQNGKCDGDREKDNESDKMNERNNLYHLNLFIDKIRDNSNYMLPWLKNAM